jgi:hypothetical protein
MTLTQIDDYAQRHAEQETARHLGGKKEQAA